MKKIVLKWISRILLVILLILFMIAAYFLLIDIETKVPRKVENSCYIETKQFMSRNIFIITLKNEEIKNDTVILYFHGGAYVAEATERHWDFIENIVKDTGATVVLPDYPLTPKYNYKDVFKMVIPLYKEIIDRVDSNNLILMGDSAGGGLGLALEEKISEELLPLPTKTILISPWLDVRLNNEEIDVVQASDKQLNKDTLKLAGISYAGEDGIDNYLVNPIDGKLANLGNIVILTGTNDILNPDVHVLLEKARKDGIGIELKEYEGAAHIWMIEKNSNEELVNKGYQDILNLIRNNQSD